MDIVLFHAWSSWGCPESLQTAKLSNPKSQTDSSSYAGVVALFSIPEAGSMIHDCSLPAALNPVLNPIICWPIHIVVNRSFVLKLPLIHRYPWLYHQYCVMASLSQLLDFNTTITVVFATHLHLHKLFILVLTPATASYRTASVPQLSSHMLGKYNSFCLHNDIIYWFYNPIFLNSSHHLHSCII